MKASDIFIGLVDFFSTLLPGMLLVAGFPASTFVKLWGTRDAAAEWGMPKWAVLVVAGYVIGQLLHLLGAKLANWVYPSLLRRFKPHNFDAVSELATAVLSTAFPETSGAEITRRSEAVVKHLSPDLGVELERLEAAAKFARGLSLVALILAGHAAALCNWTAMVLWFVTALCAFVRFIDRRLIHNRYACELVVISTSFAKAKA